MKFVCENCKAKYQIGDDKVAGKTLRMKCRRCGHMIQVSATVTESSVSKLNPTLPHPHEASAAPDRAPPAPVADLTGDVGGSQDDESATVVRPSPFFLRQTGTSPAARASVPRIVPPARPSRASVPPAPGATPGPQPGIGSPRPSAVGASRPPAPARPIGVGPLAARAAALGAASAGSAPGVAGAGPASGPRPLSTPPPSAGLSGGFSRAVAEAPAVPSHAPPTEDWYVGVGGVPLGPVRLSVIREKAAAGAVDGDSLVWREGFEEWQPLKTFPALLSLVDEARSVRQSRSLTPVPPVGTPAPKPANGHAHRESTPAPDVSPFATAANGVAAGLGSSPATNGAIPGAIPTPATSVPFSLVTPAGARPDVASDPFAAPKPSDDPADPLALGALTREPIIATRGGFGDDALRSSVAPPVSAPPERKRGVHPMAWAFVAMCAAFGGVAAWAVFLRKPETIVIQASGAPVTTTAAAPLGPAPPAPPTDLPSATPASSVATGPSNQGTGSVGNAGTSSKTPKTEASSAPPSNFDNSGFSAGGPSSGPDANATKGSGSGQLSEGEIQGVVNRSKPGITRRCWGPAYDARDSNAGKSAKVNVSITIGPSGSVQSASASGGDQFPGLASCVANSVKAWQFPASDGQSKVAIPFSFNQQ